MVNSVIMPHLGQTMTEGMITLWKKQEGDLVQEGEELFELETDKLASVVTSNFSGVLLKILVPEGEIAACKETVAYIGEQEEKILASPRAKRLAREMGIPLFQIPGSGEEGRILERDVLAYQEAQELKEIGKGEGKEKEAEETKETKGTEDSREEADRREENGETAEESARDTLVPMSSMRRAIARHMLEVHQTVPDASVQMEIDAGELKRVREQLASEGCRVSYTELLVKITAKALQENPKLNCSVEEQSIRYKDYIHIGVAVALEEGLVVPHIKDAEQKSLMQISQELRELARLAREGGLKPEQLEGGTFTITNLGMYGVDSFLPVIHGPEAAILGIGAVKDRPVVREKELLIRPTMQLSLTFDHRAVDGEVAALFLRTVKRIAEKPALLL